MTIPPRLMEQLRGVRSVAVLTGAGISAESGVPTFREAQTGLWSKYSPEDLATPTAFDRDPRLVWEWYAWRRELVAAASPNPGHFALADMERRFPEFVLITQNVDGLHHSAGNRNVVELHGNIRRTKCSVEGNIVDEWADTGEVPPRCPRCGGRLRPDVVWFHEPLPAQELFRAQAATVACEVFFSVGTSTVVYPAANLPFQAKDAGAIVVEINPSPTPFTGSADFVLAGPAGRILPLLVAGLTG